MPKLENAKGKIAVCSLGTIGFITCNDPQVITYKKCDYCIGSISGADAPELCKCEKGVAYVGIHLTDVIAPIGSPWSSRFPRVIGEIKDGLIQIFVAK